MIATHDHDGPCAGAMIRAVRRSGVLLAALAVLAAGCEGGEPERSGPSPNDSAFAAPPADSIVTTRPSDGPANLRTALEQRLGGPSTQPGDEGAASMFSPGTADALRTVAIDSTGHATVDFHDLRPLIPNASSSAGSTLLLSELNATVFRFPDIRSVEYRMEGSCDLFWEWLQYRCHTVTRPSSNDSTSPPEPNPS